MTGIEETMGLAMINRHGQRDGIKGGVGDSATSRQLNQGDKRQYECGSNRVGAEQEF